MNLRTKLSIMFGTVVFGTVSIIGIVTYNKNVEMGTVEAQKTMQVSAELASKEIEEKLADFMKMAQVSGYDIVLADSDQDAVVSAQVDNLAANYGFTSGNILDVNGISRKDGTDFSDRDYVKKALAGEVNISYYKGEIDPRQVFKHQKDTQQWKNKDCSAASSTRLFRKKKRNMPGSLWIPFRIRKSSTGTGS